MSTQSKHLRIGATAFIALIAVLGLIYAWWWSELATRAKTEAERWVQRQNANGGSASTGAVTVSGFPFTVRLAFAEPKIGWASGWSWEGPALSAEIAPWSPGNVHLSAPGRHLFRHDGAVLPLDAKDATALVSFDTKGLHTASVTLDEARFAGLRADRAEATVTPLARATAQSEQPVLSAKLALRGFKLPDEIKSPLGRGPANASLDATWKGPIGLPVTKASIEDWRNGGGTVEIERLVLDWSPLTLTGNATVALDRDLQPEGSGTAVIRGLMETFDKLAATGEMRPKDASTAKLVLGILGKPAADGAMQWSVPVTIQNQVLYIGPAALMALPKVEW